MVHISLALRGTGTLMVVNPLYNHIPFVYLYIYSICISFKRVALSTTIVVKNEGWVTWRWVTARSHVPQINPQITPPARPDS